MSPWSAWGEPNRLTLGRPQEPVVSRVHAWSDVVSEQFLCLDFGFLGQKREKEGMRRKKIPWAPR